jgi:hypothetical protein
MVHTVSIARGTAAARTRACAAPAVRIVAAHAGIRAFHPTISTALVDEVTRRTASLADARIELPAVIVTRTVPRPRRGGQRQQPKGDQHSHCDRDDAAARPHQYGTASNDGLRDRHGLGDAPYYARIAKSNVRARRGARESEEPPVAEGNQRHNPCLVAVVFRRSLPNAKLTLPVRVPPCAARSGRLRGTSGEGTSLRLFCRCPHQRQVGRRSARQRASIRVRHRRPHPVQRESAASSARRVAGAGGVVEAERRPRSAGDVYRVGEGLRALTLVAYRA